MTGHPYAALEGSPTWDVLDRALAQLEANGDVTLSSARAYVIGYLCQAVRKLGREPAATAVAWRVLRGAGWPLDRDPGAYLGLAEAVAGIAYAGDERHVALLLRGLPAELRPRGTDSPDGYLALARELVAACSAADPDQ